MPRGTGMEETHFSDIFHQASKNRAKGYPSTPADDAEWPEEWKTIVYKEYPRLPKLRLAGDPPPADFFDLIKARQSRRNFTRAPITERELSVLLKYSCGTTGMLDEERHRRAYPSGGARFPLEAYAVVLREMPGVPAGAYHYNVLDHALEVLRDERLSDEETGALFSYPWARDAAAIAVLTAVFSRTQKKYGERGYRMILEEAGHVGQNLYLAAEALGVKCVAMSGTNDEKLERLLDIDGVTESVVYALALGK